jgi:hypothetical protein
MLDHPLETSSDAAITSISGNSITPLWTQQQIQSADDRSVQRAGPASSFERSASFLPEIYTIRQSAPILLCYHCHEVDMSEYYRVIYCNMFYEKAPRHWARLNLSITTTVESRYWNLWRPTAAKLARPRRGTLPMCLKTTVVTFLESCQERQELEHDTNFDMYLGNQSNFHASNMSIKLNTKESIQPKAYLQQITDIVHH